MEGRVNRGAHMHSEHYAPSSVGGNQTPFAGEATLVGLERVVIEAHQLHQVSS